MKILFTLFFTYNDNNNTGIGYAQKKYFIIYIYFQNKTGVTSLAIILFDQSGVNNNDIYTYNIYVQSTRLYQLKRARTKDWTRTDPKRNISNTTVNCLSQFEPINVSFLVLPCSSYCHLAAILKPVRLVLYYVCQFHCLYR